MSLAQVHHISAAPGDAEAAGRFTAVGPGVSAALLAELEPLIGYALPEGVPHRPADAELRSLPQAFTYALLSDGSRVVGRTAPARGDGTAPVRFHTHAVHLPPGVPLPGDRLAVEAWRSPHWVSATPVGGGPLSDPLALLQPGPAPVREGLDDFAVSRGPWLAAVLADLRRASDQEAPAGGPVVLVEKQNADVARWLGLAAVTLPRESVERLTFTTYTRAPGSSPLRVVGAPPEDAAAAREAGLRVHVCADRPPVDGTADAWARTAARVWRSRAPELFQEARELPGDPFAAGPLAVIALCAGVALGPEERAAAAGWAAERPYALDAKRTGQLVEALTSPGIDDRTGSEFDAVGRLFGALDGRCTASVTAPLAAMLVTEAVRGGNGSLELPRRDAFVGPDGEAIAGVLAPEILTELESGAGGARPVARTVQLLRVARLLGVNGTEVLPEAVERLARTILTEADGSEGAPAFAPALLELLDEQFDVRTALLGALDRIAPEDPGAVARFLERVALPFTGTQALPHLRMCAEAPGAMTTLGRDRTAVWHRVLRAAGLSPFAEPLVLRTAVGLVWEDRAPTVEEARLLLEAATSDAHRAAGTWARLVDAALGAPADTEDGTALAHDLLRAFLQEIGGRERAALQLLELCRDLRTGAPEPGWTEQVRTLRDRAAPLEPAVQERAFTALVERLLAPDRPGAELYAFVRSDDADLIAAYDRAARTEPTRTRLRTHPAYAADCFTNWTAHPHAGTAWTTTAAALLDEVLRPAVRGMTAEAVAEVEETVSRTGSSGRANAFRDWNRSRALGRLGRRIAGRVRRG
ncbi:GTPase-associated protein 1-related protein [Streptomyces cyaneofuscatus]|uniref:GTPase-associated protein 1-related protein n=1 Tax=Streptomyces cyaneofuscatus TaxID=66883 RepID=A0ABZ1F3Y4_9ACTN|nr:GTPase-associated protein 1-related protein [Streptomyces cyaneofuscatus]WSB11092.1 GTPase-associated protein 1-related protein [Streptomyces cyaneofuscatus]WSD45375.1 GTPase-associated protein 1-related protein [Streptomyces cyaneofuscatus]